MTAKTATRVRVRRHYSYGLNGGRGGCNFDRGNPHRKQTTNVTAVTCVECCHWIAAQASARIAGENEYAGRAAI